MSEHARLFHARMPKNVGHAPICFPKLQCGTFVEVVLLWGLFKQLYSGHVDAVMRMNADALATLPSERHARPTRPSLCAITARRVKAP